MQLLMHEQFKRYYNIENIVYVSSVFRRYLIIAWTYICLKICIYFFLFCKRKLDVIVMHFIVIVLCVLCVCWANEIRPHAQWYEPYDDQHFYIDYLFGGDIQTSGKIGNPIGIINSINESYFRNNFLFPDSADDWFIHLDNVMRNKHVNALFFIKKHLNIFLLLFYIINVT